MPKQTPFQQGEAAALAGNPCEPPYPLDTDENDKWVNGWEQHAIPPNDN